jgi:hypothetical protein
MLTKTPQTPLLLIAKPTCCAIMDDMVTHVTILAGACQLARLVNKKKVRA